MPTKTPAKKQIATAARNPKPTRNKKRWLMWCIPITTVLIGVFLYWVVGGSGMSEQAKMATYLKEKYGKEFVVENYRVEGAGLGVEGDPTADARSVDEASLKFEVWDRGSGQFSDDYLSYLWSKEARRKLDSFVQATFPRADEFLVSVAPRDTVNFKFSRGTTPSIEEALDKYGDQMLYSVTVKNTVHVADTEPSKEQLIQALKLFNYVSAQPVGLPRAYYLYKYPDFTQFDQAGKQQYQFSINAEGKELRDVNAENIKPYYEKLR